MQERIYELRLVCGNDYPNKPPSIKFVTKINMPGVDPNSGVVDSKAVSVLKNWTKDNTIQDALLGIRKEMESNTFKKLSQPSEGSNF